MMAGNPSISDNCYSCEVRVYLVVFVSDTTESSPCNQERVMLLAYLVTDHSTWQNYGLVAFSQYDSVRGKQAVTCFVSAGNLTRYNTENSENRSSMYVHVMGKAIFYSALQSLDRDCAPTLPSSAWKRD